ncbi:thiamine biosynthesis protein ThiF [Algimonas ampicilliniresistens]|uniref:Thiamine biosynthesis protein ThiF n=1 Tax=Algimonas ampicilliniresistens TaxID=1298735 RepID=A0ABQ5VBV4_9PROT|nr:HesA/MoeB/ThiF family protein [Algimonas ampicilliniresistens]GLQ24930.1 thiamine biosynthesis protein ThiF [Algimonas ampicilliniresistens]
MMPDQIERYARHLVLKEIGGSGQNALLTARIAIVGAGGLGGPAALYLAAAGIGQITLIDDDTISLSNLQRQIQFETKDVGQRKVDVLAQRLQTLNPDTAVRPRHVRLTEETAQPLLCDHDLILDGTDSFATRFMVNDAALALNTPLISGAVGRFDAQVGLFGRPGPCYRCLVPDLPPQEERCAEVGVVGALTGIVGSVMAMEAIKHITAAGDTLSGRLWIYDGLTAKSRTVTLPRDPDCPVCGVS